MQLIRAFIKTDIGVSLIITLAWQLIMTVVGYIIDSKLHDSVSLLQHTYGWDAGWYSAIISDHYVTNAASAAFYPLFPLIIGFLDVITFNIFGSLVLAQVINTISIWFMIAAALKIGRIFLGDSRKFWIIVLILSAPSAFFMHLFYSEALFIALSLWAYFFALKRRWLYMALLLAVLSATRLPAILVIALCGLEFMRAYDWNLKRILNKKLFYFLLAPIGFVAYGAYLWVVRGDFFAMFQAYKMTNDWSYQVFDPNIIKTVGRVGHEVFRSLIGERAFDNDIIINHLIPLTALVTLGICSIYIIRKHRAKLLPLGIVGLLSIVMFTLNSNVVSAHRYILPCLTIYVAIALFIKSTRRPLLLVLFCISGVALQILLYALFINNVFVG